MRPIEILVCCLTLPASFLALLSAHPEEVGMWMLSLLLLAALVVHIFVEGVRWQLAPLYLAIPGILAALLLVGSSSHIAHLLPWLGLLSLLLIGLSIALSLMVPMFKLPPPTGPYAVGTNILYMVDAGRDARGETSLRTKHELHELRKLRELVVQLWYPANPAGKRAVYRRLRETTPKSSHHAVLQTHSFWNARIRSRNAPYPVLLFSPAWTGQRTQSTFLMQELASHGFVVASIDHTYYSGRVVFPDGRVLDGQSAPALGTFEQATVAEQVELIGKHVRIEAQDQIFVLDQLAAMNHDPASPWFALLDLTRVGALGHSIGGAAASEACYLDDRIRAALNIDGWVGADVLNAGLSKPWMLMYGAKERQPSPEELTGALPAVQRYWEMNRENYAAAQRSLERFGGYRLYIGGASHWNFADRALYSPRRSWTGAGEIPPLRAFEIVNRYARAFFSQTLKGTEEPLLQRDAHVFSEVSFEVWGKSKDSKSGKILDIASMQPQRP